MSGSFSPAVPRVFVVDDHAVVRQGLCDLLRSAPDLEWCGEADNAGDALRRVDDLAPGLAVVDLFLDGRGGLELVESLRERRPGLGILVLSMHEEDFYAERALRAGALGYLTKTASGTEILQALRDVAKGHVHGLRRSSPETRDAADSRAERLGARPRLPGGR